jgi:dTDP-4-amino-4,6-dideoxygalactose transaminase
MHEGIQKFRSRVRRFLGEFYRVPYCVPAWGWEEHWAILKCLWAGKMVDGADKERLYSQIRQMTGAKYVFGFNSGQQAIQAALIAGGVCHGDSVIMPSYCCETVAKAIANSGATPLFCDIGDDFNPSVDHVLQLVNPSVRAIILPHLFGNPAGIDRLEGELRKSGERSRVLLVDDAAQSFGARLHGKLLGTFGDAGIISFGPGKTMTATGGGLLITNLETLAEKVTGLEIKPVGFAAKLKGVIYWLAFRRWRSLTLPFLPFFEGVLELHKGSEFGLRKLSNIDAAIGLSQMKKLEKLLETRIARMKEIDGWFGMPGQSAFCEPVRNMENGYRCVCTKYVARIKEGIDAGKVQAFYRQEMEKIGIELKPLYSPLHLSFGQDYSERPLSKTEKLWPRIIQIPIEPSISSRRFEKIKHAFACILKRYCDTPNDCVLECSGAGKRAEGTNHA